jgi:beta-glucosidase
MEGATSGLNAPATGPGADLSPPVLLRFPPRFVWGVATSAYQVEGATTTGGRAASIWDAFCRRPGTVADGRGAEPAADQYHRYGDDVRLMSRLGVSAYRFSVAWPRVQPDGRGPAQPDGLDYYQRLVDALLAAGIEPWPTLYHWDLPLSLEQAGGWPVRDTAYRFAEYASMVHDALGDRVTRWMTINEPWCAAFLGYASGRHAPGRREPGNAVAAAHHMLLGHGLAAQLIAARPYRAEVGIVLGVATVYAARPIDPDRDAARRVDGLQHRLFLDPICRGRYPEDVREDLKEVTDFDFVADGDLAIISTPIRCVGLNYYSPGTVAGNAVYPHDRFAPSEQSDSDAYVGSEHIRWVTQNHPRTGMGWPVDPEGLRDICVRIAQEYPSLDLYVTENGAAYPDVLTGASVADDERTAFLDSHLRAVHAAMADGAPVRGYFVWSLLDNFEWTHGYTQRFGIVHVDFGSQRRTVKQSGRWYRDVIARGGLSGAPLPLS